MNDSTNVTPDSTNEFQGVWLVVQTAIYRHKIMGAYTDINRARDAIGEYLERDAEKYSPLESDKDGHHCYEICWCLLNKAITEDSDAEEKASFMPHKKLGDDYHSPYEYRWAM